jgi:TonB family protein
VEERRFHIIFISSMLVALLLGIVVAMIQLPEKERFKKQTLPPRLARLILEQKKPPPPKPDPIPKKVKKKEPPKAVKKPQISKKEPVLKKQIIKQQPSPEAARKKAARSGLLAFSDELADLREEPVLPNVQQIHQAGPQEQKALSSKRSIISSGAKQSSGGINTSALSRDTGGRGLSRRTTTQVESKDITQGSQAFAEGKDNNQGKQTKGGRTREEIQLIFDQNKGAIYALYNRALRKDPTLQGKVVLQITISPSGKVLDCKILSSELNNPRLERKLISRVKLFKFPSQDVETTIISYPIDFLPS